MINIMLWAPLDTPAYMFAVGDRVRCTPLHPGHVVSDEVGTVVEILPPIDRATLGTVVVRYADKVIELPQGNVIYPRRTWHNGGNLMKVSE